MNLTPTEQALMDYQAGLDIIDCHEHLAPENECVNQPKDVFALVSHYTRHDLHSAGMDRAAHNGTNPTRVEYESLFDHNKPLEERWKTFAPYWVRIRHGSYARAAILTARMVYGVEDINENTYQELSRRIAAENTPGLYKQILCDRCRIRASLTQCSRMHLDRPLVSVMRGWGTQIPPTAVDHDKNISFPDVRDLESLKNAWRVEMDAWAKTGVVGLKLMIWRDEPIDEKAAQADLKRLLANRENPPTSAEIHALNNDMQHALIDLAAERNLVVAMHTGIWGDFRDIDCKFMLTIAPKHPQANFDMYHLGMPSVRDAIVIAKNLPNVFLNQCWTHIISQAQTQSGVDELLDQVPVNKVLAFGGDYRNTAVEKVVGHLHMAREDFAVVFGRRIDRGLMSMDDAKEILRLWYRDNPLALYTRLKV